MSVVSRADRVHQEARNLWIEVFGEPPASGLKGGELIEALLRRLEPADYARLARAESARNLVWPRKPHA